MTRSFFRLLALAAVLTGTLANPTTTTHLEARAPASAINPLEGATQPLDMILTNGQRLARGLPLNKPHFRRQADRTGRPRARASAVPATANAAGAGGCAPRTGVIHVTGTGLDGYVSNGANSYGEYGYTTRRADALSVVVNDCDGTPFDLVSSNGFRAFRYLGAIQGFANDGTNLQTGSSNYAYLGGVSQTAPHATPHAVTNSFTAATGISESAESAIWSITKNVLHAQWVNEDGTTPATTLAYVQSEGVFVLVGDVGAFKGEFGDVDLATFTFES